MITAVPHKVPNSNGDLEWCSYISIQHTEWLLPFANKAVLREICSTINMKSIKLHHIDPIRPQFWFFLNPKIVPCSVATAQIAAGVSVAHCHRGELSLCLLHTWNVGRQASLLIVLVPLRPESERYISELRASDKSSGSDRFSERTHHADALLKGYFSTH